MSARSIAPSLCFLLLLCACGDDGASGAGGGGEGGSGPAATSSVTTGGGSTGEGGAAEGGGGGAACATTVCDGETAADPATAFGFLQGNYTGSANGSCDGVSSLLAGEFVADGDYAIQVDSGGTIFLTGETQTFSWTYLSPGDCDFACTASAATWVTYQDDTGPTPRITFAKNDDSSPETLILHGASDDCVFYPLTTQ